MEQLENYLKQEDREQGLQSLIGEKKLEAQILNELQKYQSSNQELLLLIDQMIQQFKTQYGETQGYKQLAYKFLLKKLENEQDQKVQEEVIEQLEKLFGINYPAQSFLQQVKDQKKNEYQIDEKVLQLERFQELVEKEQQNFDDFNLLYMSQLNPQILKDKKFIGWFINKGFQIIPFLGDNFNLFEMLLQDQNHSDSLIKEFEDKKMQIICQMHTQKQIENALQKFPDLYNNTELVLILINKKIKKQSPTDEELFQILNLIIDWICNQVPEKYQVTRTNLRFFFMVQLFNLKMKMNQIISFKELIQLLKIKQVCVQEENITTFQRIKSSQFLGNKNDEQEIIKKLISNWFQSQECKDIGELDSYIDAVTLQKQFDQEKVRIGLDQKYKTLGVQEVEKIQSEQFLDFDKSKNLNNFLPQDQVNLHLKVKNIQKLNIKIYEVDQELLFHKGQTLENAKLVNLDGMIPQIQFQQEVVKKYGVMQEIQVNIEQLQNRIGAFIVEIQGDRLQARLEIKKGSLYLIQKQTVSGHLCYVYNEVGIKLQQAGILVQDRLFKSDEGGKILIPYKQGGQELRSILLTGDNRMEILKFYHQSEDYKMQCAFLINEEQMIAGVDSDILLVPKLIINNQNASLKILEDIEVTILSLDEKEKSSQKTYQQLQIDSQGIIKLQYQVPAKLKEIKIQLRTKVTKVGEQEPLKLECEQTHKFKDINRFIFFDVYLRKSLNVIDEIENQSHYLQILGMNGEPKKQVENDKFEQHLKSDENGIVKLGNITHVRRVQVQISSPVPFKKEFEIQNLWDTVIFTQKSFDITEEENLTIPIPKNSKVSDIKLLQIKTQLESVQIQQIRNFQVIQEKSDCLTFHSHSLEISKLVQGQYLLVLGNQMNSIQINVDTGNYTEEQTLMLNDCFKFRLQGKEHQLSIHSVDLKNKKLKVKIQGNIKNVKILAFLRYFESQQQNKQLLHLLETVQNQKTQIVQWLNYYSQRRIGDELNYILKRKELAEQLGNTLPKPMLLINPHEVGETITQKEILESGQRFQLKEDRRMFLQKDSLSPYLNIPRSLTSATNSMSLFDLFVQFLQIPGKCLSEIQINYEEGIFEIDVEDFTNVQLFIYNPSTLISFETAVKEMGYKMQTKQLTLQGGLVPSKSYAEARFVQVLSQKQGYKDEFLIEDLASTELTIVDTLKQAFDILIQQCKTFKLSQLESQLHE